VVEPDSALESGFDRRGTAQDRRDRGLDCTATAPHTDDRSTLAHRKPADQGGASFECLSAYPTRAGRARCPGAGMSKTDPARGTKPGRCVRLVSLEPVASGSTRTLSRRGLHATPVVPFMQVRTSKPVQNEARVTASTPALRQSPPSRGRSAAQERDRDARHAYSWCARPRPKPLPPLVLEHRRSGLDSTVFLCVDCVEPKSTVWSMFKRPGRAEGRRLTNRC
jgi:hypothetical protein